MLKRLETIAAVGGFDLALNQMLFTFTAVLHEKERAPARANARCLRVNAPSPYPDLDMPRCMCFVWVLRIPQTKHMRGDGGWVREGEGAERVSFCAAVGGSGTLAVIRHNVPIMRPARFWRGLCAALDLVSGELTRRGCNGISVRVNEPFLNCFASGGCGANVPCMSIRSRRSVLNKSVPKA